LVAWAKMGRNSGRVVWRLGLKKKRPKKRKFNFSSHKTLTVVQCWLTEDQEPDEKTHHSGSLFHQDSVRPTRQLKP
jgi:hypothetical protein